MGLTMTNKQRLRIHDFRLATWNVLSLYRTGAFRMVKDQLEEYRIGVAAIQEIRWKESGIMDSGEFTMFCSSSGTANFGTGFLVHRRCKPAVTDFKAVNGRICTLRLKMRFFNLTLICVHAPTEGSEDNEKDEFYEQLEQTYDAIAANDVKMILGDMNAKIGRETAFKPNLGNHSLHQECNENGLRLVDLAMSKDLAISSTFFPRKDIHKATWKSPDGITSNQIDHVLINRRHGSDIMDVRTCRGADVESDHYMVLIKYRQRISTAYARRVARDR